MAEPKAINPYDPKTYERLQALWVKRTRLKPGDTVRVMSVFEPLDSGSYGKTYDARNAFSVGGANKDSFQEYLAGRNLEVQEINSNNIGVELAGDTDNDSGGYWFLPFWVLIKVEGADD